jgi:hypothetical protein
MLGDTLLHIACREGYDVMVAFMLDPATKSQFETLVKSAFIAVNVLLIVP